MFLNVGFSIVTLLLIIQYLIKLIQQMTQIFTSNQQSQYQISYPTTQIKQQQQEHHYYYSELIQSSVIINNPLIQQHIQRSFYKLRNLQIKNQPLNIKTFVAKKAVENKQDNLRIRTSKIIDVDKGSNMTVTIKNFQDQLPKQNDNFSMKYRKFTPKTQKKSYTNIQSQFTIQESKNMSQYQFYSLNKKKNLNIVNCNSKKIHHNSLEKQYLIHKNSFDSTRSKLLNPVKKGLSNIISNYRCQTQTQSNKPANFLNIEKIMPVQRKQHNWNIIKKNSNSDINQTVLITNAIHIKQKILPLNHITQKTSHKVNKVDSNKPMKIPFQKYYYRDFLWKMSYLNKLIIDIPLEYPKLFKVYIGPGNNKLLVKSLMRRRNWWGLSDNPNDCNFIWSQIKIKDIFKSQKKNQAKHTTSFHKEIQNLQKLIQEKDKNVQLKDHHQKFMSNQEITTWKKYYKLHRNIELKLQQNMKSRDRYFNKQNFVKIQPYNTKIHNHLENNYIIGNKKALFYTMSKYYKIINENIFDYLPITFHIQSGLQDATYLKFLNIYYQLAKQIKKQQNQKQLSNNKKKTKRNVWIVKPGQFTNRGNGITVCLNLQSIKCILKTKEKHPNGNVKTYIIQSYMDRPFLYNRRKFDIRHYMMITCINGIIKGYWYQQGYIRTTSFEYTLKSNSTGIHLTNDAIQKYLPEYGKYEKGNKLSYQDFQKYLEKQHGKKYNFFADAYPIMKKIATDAIKASFIGIDKNKRQHNFEIFGMDFMIDENFRPWLIEINTNPCLELSCPLLQRIIPNMLQNCLRITIDPLFPPPIQLTQKINYFEDNALQKNRFHLVFNSLVDGDKIIELYSNIKEQNQGDLEDCISSDDEVYDDEGNQWDN